MKASTISSLKRELNTLTTSDLVEICLKLAKYKKENKELISYLLFDANDELEYINNIKKEIDLQFSEINFSQMYYIRKSVRKIFKTATKYIRYSGKKRTEVELLIYFCLKLKTSGIHIERNNSLNNLYKNQLQKIRQLISTLHEDLQHDYLTELAELIKLS
jgi:hypothetical protein